MASETYDESLTLCDRQGRDGSAGHSPTSFVRSPSRSAPVVGTPIGAFLFEMTNNLAASTWVGVGGKKLCSESPGLSCQELPGLLAPDLCSSGLDHAHGDSPLGVRLKHGVGLMPAPSQ